MQGQYARRDVPSPPRRSVRRAESADGFLSAKCATGFAWYRERSPALEPIRRTDVDPFSMQGFLEHIMLVDVEYPAATPGSLADDKARRTDRRRAMRPWFRFSLVGGHIDANYDERLKGRYLHDLDLNVWRNYWLNVYELPVRERYPVTDRVNVVWRDMDFMSMEYVLIPVDGPSGAVDRLLIVAEFTMSLSEDPR